MSEIHNTVLEIQKTVFTVYCEDCKKVVSAKIGPCVSKMHDREYEFVGYTCHECGNVAALATAAGEAIQNICENHYYLRNYR